MKFIIRKTAIQRAIDKTLWIVCLPEWYDEDNFTTDLLSKEHSFYFRGIAPTFVPYFCRLLDTRWFTNDTMAFDVVSLNPYHSHGKAW